MLMASTNSDASTPVIAFSAEGTPGICRDGYPWAPSEQENWQQIYSGDDGPLFEVFRGDTDKGDDCDSRCPNFCWPLGHSVWYIRGVVDG